MREGEGGVGVPGRSFLHDLMSFLAREDNSVPGNFCLSLLTDIPMCDFWSGVRV